MNSRLDTETSIWSGETCSSTVNRLNKPLKTISKEGQIAMIKWPLSSSSPNWKLIWTWLRMETQAQPPIIAAVAKTPVSVRPLKKAPRVKSRQMLKRKRYKHMWTNSKSCLLPKLKMPFSSVNSTWSMDPSPSPVNFSSSWECTSFWYASSLPTTNTCRSMSYTDLVIPGRIVHSQLSLGRVTR